MLSPEELIDMMENIGYNAAMQPENSLYAFEPSETALPILAPVTVTWPSDANGPMVECRIWFDLPECEAETALISDFAARFNWVNAPWKLLFNPEEFEFCIQMTWPCGPGSVSADDFFDELLSGCCLVQCLYASLLAVEDGLSADDALMRLEDEYATLINMVDEQGAEAFETFEVVESELIEVPKKKAAKKVATKKSADKGAKKTAKKSVDKKAVAKKTVSKKSVSAKTVTAVPEKAVKVVKAEKKKTEKSIAVPTKKEVVAVKKTAVKTKKTAKKK